MLNVNKSFYLLGNQIQRHQISDLLKTIKVLSLKLKADFRNYIQFQIPCALHYSTLTKAYKGD